MKFPSKITPYSKSVIFKFIPILTVVEKEDIGVLELRKRTSKCFNNTSEFLLTLDCLYALNKLEYNNISKVLHYVK